MQKKTKIQLGVIMVASIALVLMIRPLIQKPGGEKGPPPVSRTVPGPSPAVVAPGPNTSGQTIKLRLIKDDKFYERINRVADVLPLERDPFFFAYTGPRSPRDSLELTGILWGNEKPTAIINQAFLSAGDSTDQFSVVKILEDRVILKDRNGEFELHLK